MHAPAILRSPALSLALAATFAFACADDDTTSPVPSPLAGLARVAPNDNDTTTTPPVGATPGFFHGTVLGPSAAGAGPDTLATAPRVANVRVNAYLRVASSTDTLGIGPLIASVMTDANGEWTLPVLPGGLYIVTFTVPDGSPYTGVWATAIAHSHSSDYPWWVVLAKK
jgi:hypothetical protein